MPNVKPTNLTGADDPLSITHAISLNGGHLGWAVLSGNKKIENRNFRLRGWYGLALTQMAHTGVQEDHDYRSKFPSDYPGFQAFESERGKLIGAVYVSHNLPHSACAFDSFACPNYRVKNIITKTIRLPSPIPCKGNLGSWRIPDDVLKRFNGAVHSIPIFETGAGNQFPPQLEWESSSKIPFEEATAVVNQSSARPRKTINKSNSKRTTEKAKKPPPKSASVSFETQTQNKPSDIRNFFATKTNAKKK